MAGSFGYKRGFYDVSVSVAGDLIGQLNEAESDGERTILASGISCYEQIAGLTGRDVFHPLEFVLNMIHAKQGPEKIL
jgi:hypothetical protein